jgi:hypothetical protein
MPNSIIDWPWYVKLPGMVAVSPITIFAGGDRAI